MREIRHSKSSKKNDYLKNDVVGHESHSYLGSHIGNANVCVSPDD